MRGSSSSTRAAAGDSGTMRAPVLESGRRSSPSSRSTCSHLSVTISLRRHPVSISRRNAAAGYTGSVLSASISFRTSPRRRNSSSVRNRSRFFSRYLRTNLHGLPPVRSFHNSARLNSLLPDLQHPVRLIGHIAKLQMQVGDVARARLPRRQGGRTPAG